MSSQSPVIINAISATSILKLALEGGNTKKICEAMSMLALAMSHFHIECAKQEADLKLSASLKTPLTGDVSSDLEKLLVSYGKLERKFEDYCVVNKSLETYGGVKYRTYITHAKLGVITTKFDDIRSPGLCLAPSVEIYNTPKEAVAGWLKHCENFEKYGINFYTKTEKDDEFDTLMAGGSIHKTIINKRITTWGYTDDNKKLRFGTSIMMDEGVESASFTSQPVESYDTAETAFAGHRKHCTSVATLHACRHTFNR